MINRKAISLLATMTATAMLALPALAETKVVFKRQLDLPTLPVSIQRQISAQEHSIYYRDYEGEYFDKKLKNLPIKPSLVKEIECDRTVYRAWSAALDIVAVSKRVGFQIYQTGSSKYVFEATRGGKSKYKISGPNDLVSLQLFACNGNELLVSYVHDNRGSIVKATFDSFDNERTWNNPAFPDVPYRSLYEIEVDGVRQLPGRLTMYRSKNVADPRVYGDSRVFVVNGPAQGLHSLPWYRDIKTVDVGDSGDVTVDFYRLSDGYGIAESIRKENLCSAEACPSPRYEETLTYYRIYDGQSSYSVVSELPLVTRTTGRRLSMTKNGLALYDASGTYSKGILIHGLPELTSLSSLAYRSNGSVLWENAERIYVRYFLVLDKNRTQYWEATIQK